MDGELGICTKCGEEVYIDENHICDECQPRKE